MSNNILVVNAGSSSVKFALFCLSAEEPVATMSGQISNIGKSPLVEIRDAEQKDLDFALPAGGITHHSDAFEALIDWLEGRGDVLVGAAHRVVHGGAIFTAPIIIDETSLKSLQALSPLAPHHQPYNLAAIEALAKRLPGLPQVACFDTAFHATLPRQAQELGLPKAYADRGIRRYGFHGLSYESVATDLPAITGAALPARLVIAHLGNGASMCALKDGKSIATTMGFSTLDGIPMGTRSGAIDPGVLLHLMREDGAGLAELEDLLYNQSGLLGVSGASSDMRDLLNSKDKQAAYAVTYFCNRISRELGSLAAALGGLDALVFTGGIGENAAPVRAQILHLSKWLGLDIDDFKNNKGGPRITTTKSTIACWVIATREEQNIARHARRVLKLS